jgi:purine-binding chemotaxis protein CheW
MLNACSSRLQIGQQNADAARRTCASSASTSAYCRVGGKCGRTITIDCATCDYAVQELVTTTSEADMPDASATSVTELFGSFVLGEDEFALPASCFREVVNYPDKMTTLPLSPRFLEGIFTLRGSVIPIVNLGRVFNPERAFGATDRQNRHPRLSGVLVGILFDATGEILRVRPEQRSTLAYRWRKGGVVAGTILLDHGARLVQMLDPGRADAHRKRAASAGAAIRRPAARRTHGERRQCVSFCVGVPRLRSRWRHPGDYPRAGAAASVLNSALCLGRINFRGSPVAVVDFAILLNAATPSWRARRALPDQRIIVARIDDATIGFLVDSVDNIVNFYSEEIMPIPMLSKARAGMFGGCLSKPELGDIFFLDHQQIFSSNEIKEMRTGHANLYPKDEAQVAKMQRRDARAASARSTSPLRWKTAMRSRSSRCARSSTSRRRNHAPTRPAGLHARHAQPAPANGHRIDLRGLYGMAPLQDTSQSKILVVERGDECYGLLVDAVENIMTIADNKRFGAPKMMRNPSAQGDPRTEMDEVIDIEGDDAARSPSACSSATASSNACPGRSRRWRHKARWSTVKPLLTRRFIHASSRRAIAVLIPLSLLAASAFASRWTISPTRTPRAA